MHAYICCSDVPDFYTQVLLAPFDFILPIHVNSVAKRFNKLLGFLGGVPSSFPIGTGK